MKVDKNKVVALSYELTVDGAVADKASAEKPLEYIHGKGMLLPRFEEEVAGKEVGEKFEFTLNPEEGYGTYSADYVFELPKSAFEMDGKVREDLLVPGRVIPMMSQSGEVVQGVVKEVKKDSVLMDFNHPMAGKTLHFTGSVVNVREATPEELENGLKRNCGCQKGTDCKKGAQGDCECSENCNCGDECKCDDECSCGDKCECTDDCTCADKCECTEENKCNDKCNCK